MGGLEKGKRPVEGFRISAPFGEKRKELADKLDLKHTVHTGVDFACPVDTQVCAFLAGKVAIAHDNSDGLGLRLGISHDDGMDIYAHLNVILVNVGDKVGQGQVVAISGNTGKSTGAHLHFETRKWNGKRYEAIEPIFV